ncbi:MAG TPA: AAA family ATPase [Kofleriaceae bacterium]|nr:AAA family ATPase [Kofleriaceae bacterium]
MVATYPGTVSPLRGLDPFGEAERDVWQGRETERDEIAKLVTADGFRAGLLFGEPGVGKTSLVRAGLIPYLRDHGIVALACEDLTQPAASFAAGLAAFGIQPTPNETPVAFITRAVAAAVKGQQFVFIVDDVDLVCTDERATTELSDLFARVVSRSAGRARFLFVCASNRLHVLGALEKRTGSLFPPSQRYELKRISASDATTLLDRILSYSGVAADPKLAEAVVMGLGHGQPMLPADLQLASLALRDLRISNEAGLHKVGGATELEEEWLNDACRATGNERSAMRLVAEVAVSGPGPVPAADVIRHVTAEPSYANHAFQVLEQRGVIIRGDAAGTTWMLRHEILANRVRELTAPARAAARRAFDLLGSKAGNKQRLTIMELYALRHEGIAPVTASELAVVQRSRRYYLRILGAIAAVPILIIIIIWIALAGRVYFDLTPRAGGDSVVVRGGRAGLSSFFWLPGSFGDEVADTGLTRAMVAPEAWAKIDNHDLGSSRGSWDDQLKSIMAPQLAGLVEYATTGNEQTLERMRKAAKDPEDLAELLTALRPIARGTPAEVQLVESALTPQSPPAVQRAAVSLAGAAAQRQTNVYNETLTVALTSPDAELRRIAFASVRNLGDRGQALFQAALNKNPDTAARRELLVETSVGRSEDTPTVATAVAVLSDKDATPAQHERARAQINSALIKEPEAAATALVALIAQDRAPSDARVYAIEQMRELDPMPKVPNLVEAAHSAFISKSPAVRAAALPLYAKVDPVRAGGDLATMLDDKKLDKPLKIAAALGWGEVARTNLDAARNALDRMLKDEDSDVRAAAAQAAGKAGRTYQEQLVKMAKNENYVVRIGAARGLAASAEAGASVGTAVGGIAQLWKEKGRPRREAARVYADLAKKKPQAVMSYLSNAARTIEDPSLHPIGAEGLCNAALAGNAEARRQLALSTDDKSVDVRKIVMACVADGPDPAKNGAQIAMKLVHDSSGDIRKDAARVLSIAATKGGTKIAGVGEALVELLDDQDHSVRLVAIRAIAGLGTEAPKSAAGIMAKMFPSGDEGEKLAMLRSARAIGAEELITLGVADSSPLVRIEAVDTALASGKRAGQTLSAALADSDPQVRKAALERLAAQKDKLDPQTLDRTLALAVRDPNPELSQLALTTIARVAAKPNDVAARLRRSLASRAERERAQAAAAAIGLVDRDAALTVQLLDPLLEDPSHDVRVAMLPALAAAYAKTNDAEKLAEILRDSEGNAMRRLVAAAAFVTLARTDAGQKAAVATLGKIAKDGPAMARMISKLTGGLIAGKADGMAFLQELVP